MLIDQAVLDDALEKGKEGLLEQLETLLEKGNIKEPAYQDAKENAPKNLERWLHDPDIDRLSPNAKQGIIEAIEAGQFQQLLNAFARDVKFGTGGIREKMGYDRNAILKLKEEGI